jgi:hypothetical protein
MSEMGQKQTLSSECSMSALPPKVDIHRHDGHVRFVPDSDIAPKHVGSHAKRERYNAGN